MALSDNAFLGLDAVDLATLKATYLECVIAIGKAGQSYTINSRTFTKADLAEVKRTLKDINQAIGFADGTVINQAQATV